MKRVLMVTGISLFLSLALLSFLPTKTQIIPAIIFAFITFVILLFKKRFNFKSMVLVSGVICFACFLLFFTDILNTLNLKQYNRTTMTFNGYVESVEGNGCVFKTQVDGKVRNIYLVEYDKHFKNGETLRVKADISEVTLFDFSKERNFKSKNCYLVGENCEIIPIAKTSVSFYPKIKSLLWDFSDSLSQSIDKLFSNKTKGVLKAILLGNKNEIPTQIKEDFKTAGLSHYTAISGLHTGIIAGAVFFLFKKLNKRIGAVLTVLFVLFYMSLVGFSFSVTRAGIMSIITFIGIAFFLRSDTLTSLGGAVAIILLFNPYSAADIGFQLSVLATFGVIVVSPKINSWLNNRFEKLPFKPIKTFVFAAISTTLGANVMLVFHYLFVLNNISLVSPISNLLASAFMPYPVIFGMICVVINQFPGLSVLAGILKYLAEIPMLVIIKIANFMSLLPYANVATGQLFLSGWFLLTVAVVGYFALTKRNNFLKRIIILSLSSLFVLVLCYNVSNSKNITMSMSNSYSGNAIVGMSTNANFVVSTSFDDYTVYGIEKALDISGVRTIDVLFLDNDNKLLLAEFLNKYKVKQLCINKQNFTDEHINSFKNRVDKVHALSKADVCVNKRMSVRIRTDSFNNLAYLISLDNVNVLLTKGKFNLLDFQNEFLESNIFIINNTTPSGIEHYNISQIYLTNSKEEQKIYNQVQFLCDSIDSVNNFATFKIRDNRYKLIQ